MKIQKIISILFVIFLVGCTTTQPSQESNQQTKQEVQKTEMPSEKTPTPPSSNSFSLEDVSEHNNGDDCWLAINGKVYDVTDYVSNHPGGAAILEGCGTDGTTLYETRPMGSGSPHSSNARNLLEDYYIGELN